MPGSRHAPFGTIGLRKSVGLLLIVLVTSLVAGAEVAEAGERPFVHRLTSEPTSLDPAKSNRIQDDQVMWLLYDALTQLSADGTRMEPALAERWEQSADGLTYTFSLRKNVHFHDGSPLDAEAVKVSYERQYLTGSRFYATSPPNAYERVLAGLIKEVQVLDPYTVAITLQYPRPSQFALVKVVSPRALMAHGLHLTRTPVGTGPFRLERWETDRILLTPFADSWRGRPRLSQIAFAIVPDLQSATERLEAGEFDFIPEVTAYSLERLAANPLIRLVKVGGLNVRFLGMQVDRPAIKERRVREAIARAVDRERLATYLGRGAMIAARGPLPPASLSYDSQLHQPVFDPPRARALLKEAGMDSGLTLRLLYNAAVEPWSETAQAIRSDLRKVGVEIELLGTPDWKTYHAERRKGEHDLYLYGWSVSTPDPERFLFPLFHSKSPDNFGHYSNPRMDELLEQARQPMDEGRRLRTYREATRVLLADVPAVFLYHQVNFAAHHVRVAGLTLNLYGLPQDKLTTVEVR
ncbi:MAG: ABC transporter substrate-binding protein [Candidatus Methylomirabilota bacterium]